jgi:hypothetical protein
MGTYVASTPGVARSRILVGVLVVAVVGALALGVALATRAIRLDPLTTTSSLGAEVHVSSGLGAGYPPHYGLAGPSNLVQRVGPVGGAPVHGGLAGPSKVESSQ